MVSATPTLAELAALTRRRLTGYQRRVVPPGSLVPAAVLLVLVDRGEPHVVFAKRTDRVGHHPGQIAFPGGVVKAADPSPLAGALRECEEEIALPRDAVEPLGTLDDTETFATNFVITPFVGVVRQPVVWQPDGEEIEKVIEIPFAALVADGTFRVEHWERSGVTRPVYFYDYQGETVWGATARILKQYLDLVTAPA
jgi:8-oxo-dGTP pyrophosphatase MutT (NUDIX family)